MKKSLILILIIMSVFCNAQDTKTKNIIKAKYMVAQQLFEQNDYTAAIEKIEEIEKLLQGKNLPTLLNLKIKALLENEEPEEAKRMLDILYSLNLSNEILKDIANYENLIANKIIDAQNSARIEKEKKIAKEKYELESRIKKEKEYEVEMKAKLQREAELYETLFSTYDTTFEIPKNISSKIVLENYINAIGGFKAIENLNNLGYKMTSNTPFGLITVSIIKSNRNKYRRTFEMGNKVVSVEVFDGFSRKNLMDGEKIDIDLDNYNFERLYFPEFYSVDDAELIGITKIKNKDAYIIKWSDKIKSFYDVRSGLLIADLFVETNVESQNIESFSYYDDYIEVDGVKMPSRFSSPIINNYIDFKLTNIESNLKLSPEIFTLE